MWKPSSPKGSRSSSRLYLFVTSWQPDPYVNVIVYALQNFKLTHVYFISVVEHGYIKEEETQETQEAKKAEETERGLDVIKAGIESRFRELSHGFYTRQKKSEKNRTPEVVEIDPKWAKFYEDCYARLQRLEITSVVIPWIELDERLAFFSRDGRGIFDVTAFKKNLLVDTVVLLLSRGCTKVFDFEILKKGPRLYNETELIHNLEESNDLRPGDFIYRNLAENDHVRHAEKRMVAHSLQVRSLLILTAAVGLLVIFVQIFFSKSWPETAIGVTATTSAIVAAIPLQRDRS